MKVVNLKLDAFTEFVKNSKLDNFYQSVEYGNLMSKFGFSASYVGFIHDDSIIGASLILNRPIFMGFKYGYAPHGLIVDYNNMDMLPEMIKRLKSFLFKKSYLIIKIDPLIIKSVRDEEGKILESNPNIDNIMLKLKKNGFNHCGFNNYMEAVKPRWHAILNIANKDAPTLFYELEKNVRNKLRKAVKYGIEIYKDNTFDIEKMYEFISNKGNYSLRYYKEFKNSFGNKFELYFARINTEVYVENSKQLYEKEAEINDYLNNLIQNEGLKGKDMRTILNKKMESDRILSSYKNHLVIATKLLKEYPNNLIIGGAIIINHNNKLYLLIEGYNDQYNNLGAGYLMKWKIIEKYAKSGIEYFDLNAISGDFTDNNKYKGLNEAKLGYNSKAIEYIGEFNLIVNKPMYALYRNTKDKYSLKEAKK